MPCHCFLRVGVIAAPRLAYPNPLTAESHLVSRTTRSTGSPLVPTGLPQLVRRPSILGLLSPVASSLGVTHDVKTAKERGLGARATARRDVLCPCGSGRRFQHCCVQPGRSPKPARLYRSARSWNRRWPPAGDPAQLRGGARCQDAGPEHWPDRGKAGDQDSDGDKRLPATTCAQNFRFPSTGFCSHSISIHSPRERIRWRPSKRSVVPFRRAMSGSA